MENGLREGRYWVVGGKYGCAQLHVFTRIYRFLHKVLAVTLRALTAGKGLPALPSKADGKNLGSGKRQAESGKVDRLFPLRDRLNPPFPR